MDKPAIKELQGKAADEITTAIPTLEREDLSELLALEADSNSPREAVTKAAVAQIEVLDDEPDAKPAKGKALAAKTAPAAAAAPDPKRDHKHPDYSGPLTIDQADWRNRNLKPATVAKKK